MIFEFYKFDYDYDTSRFYKKIDKYRWEMSSHTVNAYFHPLRNEIVFPAEFYKSHSLTQMLTMQLILEQLVPLSVMNLHMASMIKDDYMIVMVI